MNAAQQELVQTTFARLAVMPEVAGALFYERLFATNPSFRPLFKNDMRIQVGKTDDDACNGRLQFASAGSGSACDPSTSPSVMSSMASSSPTTTRCGKRCSGLSNRRSGKI